MKKIVYDLTYQQEEIYWWSKVRRKIIFDLIKKFSDIERSESGVKMEKRTKSSSSFDSNKTILDIGCGTGFLLKKLQNFGKAYGVDCAQQALDYCRKRGLENVKKGNILDIPFSDNQFDIVLALDILEHVGDDGRALREISRILKKNGIAVIFVPACQFLWGITDEISHHFRRYRQGALTDKIQKENFRILKASYFNTFLFMPIALVRLFLRLFKIKIESENKIEPKFLNPILHKIFWLESWLLKYLNFSFGVSILFVIQKK